MTLADDLLNGLDIVDVVGRYVSLKRAGANYKGLCPFHGEKSPSFVVSPQKQIFKCFGCGEGGNAITFIKRYENVDFIDAAKILAKDAGVDMSSFENIKYDKKEEEWKATLKRMNKVMATYFRGQLAESSDAMQYVSKQRHLPQDIIEKFQLGYAPDNYYSSLQFLKGKGFSDEQLLLGSFAKRSHGSDQYAFFRGRLMFPIRDHMSNVVGFGGRAMNVDQKPKYVNTTDTATYDKSGILYGINFLREGIKLQDFVIIVEGYMDVIALSRLGFDNAVATCGTSLTAAHIKLLKRYSENVYLLFDNDKAGFTATKRALKLAYSYDIYPGVLRLAGDGKDLDDMVNSLDAESYEKAVETMIQTKVDGLVFVADELARSYDLSSPVDKKKLLDELMGLLVYVTNYAIQDHYLQVLSDSLSMSKQVLEAQLKQYVRKEGKVLQRELSRQESQSTVSPYKLEGDVLTASLLYGDYRTLGIGLEYVDKVGALLAFAQKVGLLISDSLIAKMVRDELDEQGRNVLEQEWLWRENELDLDDKLSDEKKYHFIRDKLQKEVLRCIQMVNKFSSISEEEKVGLLNAWRDLFST